MSRERDHKIRAALNEQPHAKSMNRVGSTGIFFIRDRYFAACLSHARPSVPGDVDAGPVRCSRLRFGGP